MFKKELYAPLLLVGLILGIPLTGAFTVIAQEEDVIENIEIRGTRRVPQDTVKFHILSQKNAKLDPNVLRRDFKNLWDQGFFDDLKIEIEEGKTGKIVIFWVKEKPLIRDIKYPGLKSATNSEVLDKFKEKKVGLGIETPFDPNKIQRAITVLTDLLAEKGHQYAEVNYETTDVPPNSKLLTFIINEGPKVKVSKINFHGNTLFSGRELRKSMKYIKQKGLISTFTGKSTFDRQKLEASLELGVRAKYNEKGYIKLLIEDPKVDVRDVRGISFFPIPFKSWKGKRVFIDVETKLVNIVFDFDEGRQFKLRRLEFVGNTTTRDKVIRREMLVNEGEIFSTALFDISLLRLNQLGFFDVLKQEDADIKPDPKDPWVDVNLKVKEKGKNSIGFTGGVSGYAGSFLGLNYSTNNFMGFGETLSVSLQGGSRMSAYIFSFTEPYFRDRPLTTGFSVFHTKYSYREGDYFNPLGSYYGTTPLGNELFGQKSTGFTLFGSYPIRPFTRFGLNYSLARSSTDFASSANQAFFSAFQFTDTFTGFGSYSGLLTSKITPSLTYNTVNNPYSPTSGKSFQAAVEFTGGPLGGNVKYIRPLLDATWYKPVNKRRNTIGMHLQFAYLTGFGGLQAPIFDRFFSGGEYSVRGFDFRLVSPLTMYTTKTFTQVTRLDPTGRPVIDPVTGGVIVDSVPRFASYITPVG